MPYRPVSVQEIHLYPDSGIAASEEAVQHIRLKMGTSSFIYNSEVPVHGKRFHAQRL
jgi:hypothetical protein